MYQRKSRRVTLTAWLLSALLNLLILFLLTLFPQQLRFRQEISIQVDMISIPDQPKPTPRVARRPRTARSEQSLKTSASKPPPPSASAVPLTTYARHIVRASNELVLTAPDETLQVDAVELPVNLVARSNAQIQTGPLTRVNTSRATGLSVDVPRRAGTWLKKLQGEAGDTPQAQVSGSGQGLSGYYDIATVQHEDAADAIRTQALSHLVIAMNRWTNVRTQLLPDSMPLADQAIQRIPLVYIVAESAFAFSEKERANLRAYLQNGGTLLFSDVSPEWGTRGPVANSIRFELWKLLGEKADLRPVRREDTVCASFFEFKKGVPVKDKQRSGFYALWLDGRITVFYDAAGLGLMWGEDDNNEKWLQWGVNLIVYTLVSRREHLISTSEAPVKPQREP